MFPNTVDITKQQATLSGFPGLDSSAWYQDILAKALSVGGYLNIAVSATAPLDVRQIWYQIQNPPSGSPGQPYKYDPVALAWVPMTPTQFVNYLSIVPRSNVYSQATAPTTAQNPQPCDWWFCTTDGRLQVYTPIASGVVVWLDISGSALSGASLTPVGDANYTVLPTDMVVGTSAALTANRTWTLPAANTCNAGQEITLIDMAGVITGGHSITISHSGSDTINGTTSAAFNTQYGTLLATTDGVSKWITK